MMMLILLTSILMTQDADASHQLDEEAEKMIIIIMSDDPSYQHDSDEGREINKDCYYCILHKASYYFNCMTDFPCTQSNVKSRFVKKHENNII